MDRVQYIKNMKNYVRTQQISAARVSKRFNDSFLTSLSVSVSKGKVLCLFILILSLSGIVNASMCDVYCGNCSDCETKLNWNNVTTVCLNSSIWNHSGTCINNPANFTNKTFDCQKRYTIEGNDGTDYGIYTVSKNNNKIQNCVITDFYFGIFLASSSNNTIANNTLSSKGNGIYLGWSSNNTLINNTLQSNNDSGIYLDWFSSNNTLINNTVQSNNDSGIYLENSTNNNIMNNNVYSNGWNGIYLYFFSNNNILINNTVQSNNDSGICLSWSSNNTLQENNISNNSIGVHFSSTSNYNNLTENFICWNSLDVNDSDANSGEKNTCDTTYNYNESGTDGCATPCTQLFSLQYNLYRKPGPLNTGVNLISFPLMPSPPMTTADDVCSVIPNLEAVVPWDPINQLYKSGYACALKKGNFNLSKGIGYFVSVSANTTLTLNGSIISPEPIDLITKPNSTGSTGVNLIGLPYNSTLSPFTAEGLCQSQGIPNLEAVVPWDPINQEYKSGYSCVLKNGNFNLSKGIGYSISVTVNTTWTPS